MTDPPTPESGQSENRIQTLDSYPNENISFTGDLERDEAIPMGVLAKKLANESSPYVRNYKRIGKTPKLGIGNQKPLLKRINLLRKYESNLAAIAEEPMPLEEKPWSPPEIEGFDEEVKMIFQDIPMNEPME